MSPRRIAFAITLLIVVLASRQCQAGQIAWSYQWNANPIVVDANPLGPNHSAGGGIQLTPGAIAITGGNPGVALGNSNIIAVNLTAFTFSPSPDGKYSFSNAPYHLGITLTDVASKKSGTLNFSGVFYGSLTDWTANLYTRFTSSAQQSLVLGHDRYSVSLTSYTPPQAPAEGGSGKISAFVNVQPVSAAEPSSLILACTGLAAALVSLVSRFRAL